jgi:hypothetical protein
MSSCLTKIKKAFSPELFHSGIPIKDCIPWLSIIKNKCNLDPWGYYSSIIGYTTLLLDEKCKLSLPERISLLLHTMAAVTPSSNTYLLCWDEVKHGQAARKNATPNLGDTIILIVPTLGNARL